MNQKDLLSVCWRVYVAKTQGKHSVTINGVTFDDLFFDSNEGGRCQENARKAYEATTGRSMPGKDETALKTYRNLAKLYNPKTWDELKPGDFLYFSGGSAGHVGIYWGGGKMWQQTSSGNRGICIIPISSDQEKRFLGGFRLIPYEEDELKIVNIETGEIITRISGSWRIPTNGNHIEDQRKLYLERIG